MKYFLIALFLAVLLIIAGCTSSKNNTPIPTEVATAITTPPTVSITTTIPTNVPSQNPAYSTCDSFTKCVNSGGDIKSCNPSYPKNPCEAAGDMALELLHCTQGVGSLEYCYEVADRNGMSHEQMKKFYCRTTAC